MDGSIIQFEKQHGKIIARGRNKIVMIDRAQTEFTKPYRFLENWYWSNNNYDYLNSIPEGYLANI